MKLSFNPRILLSLFFIGAGIYAVVAGRDWAFNTRLFPWLAGFFLLGLAFVQLVQDLRGAVKQDSRILDFEFAKGVDTAMARRRMAGILAWLFGFAVAIWLTGFFVSVPAMVFLYLKVQSRESWVLSVVLTGVAFGFFWVVFDQLLHLPFPEPKLITWFT